MSSSSSSSSWPSGSVCRGALQKILADGIGSRSSRALAIKAFSHYYHSRTGSGEWEKKIKFAKTNDINIGPAHGCQPKCGDDCTTSTTKHDYSGGGECYAVTFSPTPYCSALLFRYWRNDYQTPCYRRRTHKNILKKICFLFFKLKSIVKVMS